MSFVPHCVISLTENLEKAQKCDTKQWRIQDFQDKNRQPIEGYANCFFGDCFLSNSAWKWKNLDRETVGSATAFEKTVKRMKPINAKSKCVLNTDAFQQT